MNNDLQNHLNQSQKLFGIAVQEAIVSESAKPLGQDMLHNEPKKVLAFGATVAGFAGTGFDIFKSDVSVFIGDDIIFTDDAPV